MAEDWTKMRASLLRHPKVIGMVNYLSREWQFFNFVCQDSVTGGEIGGYDPDPKTVTDFVTKDALRFVTVSGLLSLWSSARMHSDGGTIRGLTIDDLDEMAGIPCFGKALESVEWATYDKRTKAVTLPNFTDWNNQDFKGKPKSNAERQKEWRERNKSSQQSDRNESNESNARVEESRVEDIIPPTPLQGDERKSQVPDNPTPSKASPRPTEGEASRPPRVSPEFDESLAESWKPIVEVQQKAMPGVKPMRLDHARRSMLQDALQYFEITEIVNGWRWWLTSPRSKGSREHGRGVNTFLDPSKITSYIEASQQPDAWKPIDSKTTGPPASKPPYLDDDENKKQLRMMAEREKMRDAQPDSNSSPATTG